MFKIIKEKNHKVINILGLKFKIPLHTDKSDIKKIENYLCSVIVNIRSAQTHPDVFAEYKNKYIGRDVVLIGGGPTVKYFEPLENAVYVTVNDCCKYDKVDFDYLFLQELHFDETKNQTANSYLNNRCIKFYGILPEKRLQGLYPKVRQIPQSHIVNKNIKRYYLDDRFAHNFAYDLTVEPLGDFGGTAFSAMQFILWTNPKRIYLVGIDCSNEGHSFNKQIVPLNVNLHKSVWQKLKKFKEDIYPDTEIISVNPVGLKGLFKDTYTKCFLNSEV